MVWSAVLVRFLYICFTLLAPTPIFFTKMFIGELLFAIPSQRVFLVFECDSLVNQCSCVGVWARNQQMLILPGGAFGGWLNHKCSPAWKKKKNVFFLLLFSPFSTGTQNSVYKEELCWQFTWFILENYGKQHVFILNQFLDLATQVD